MKAYPETPGREAAAPGRRPVLGRWPLYLGLAALLGLGAAATAYGLRQRLTRPVRAQISAAPPAALPLVAEDWTCSQADSISNEEAAVITCNTPHGLAKQTNSGQNWVFHVSGATGSWAGINGRYEVEVLDETHLRIPADTREAGPFENQTVVLNRGDHDWHTLTLAGYAGLGAIGAPTPGGLFEITVPAGYTTTLNDRGCPPAPVASFTVASGVADVRLSRPLYDRGDGQYTLFEGRPVHFRDFADERLNSTAYLGARGADRPHRLLAFNRERTQLQVAVDVPDGVYEARPGATAAARICSPNAFNFMFIARNANGYPYPEGRVSNYTKGGVTPPEVNRLEFWIKWTAANRRRADGGYIGTIGTYVKAPDDPDVRAERYHFYHHYNPNIYPNRWIKFILNGTPQHGRSASGNAVFPNEPLLTGWPQYTSPLWDGRSAPYMPSLTYFYIDGGTPPAEHETQQAWIAPFYFDKAEGEPDAYVSSITATWSPERLDGRGPGYEIGFNCPKHSRDVFEIRYSTEGSLKQSGFASGKSGGTLNGLGGPYTNLMWYSPRMPEQEGIWVGIRPRMKVLGVSRAGVSPIIVTLTAAPLLRDGDPVTVSGIGGNTAANRAGAAVRNVPGAFWQLGSGLLSVEVQNNQGTVKFDRPHGLVAGQVIEIVGSASAPLGRNPVRLYTVQGVPAPDTLTIVTEGVKDGTYDQSASRAEVFSVRSWPALALEGTGNGDFGGGGCARSRLCSGDGFVTATSENSNFTEVFLPPFERQPRPNRP